MSLQFNKHLVLDAADFILKNNLLSFDPRFFLQIRETTMSTIFAPVYSNLTMAYHEVKVHFTIKNTQNLVASKEFEENLIQFLDSCEIILNTNLTKPNDLQTILN